MGAVLPKRSEDEKWAIFILNGSSKPIYDVLVESQRAGSGGSASPTQNAPLRLGAVPTGSYVVPSHPKFKWGNLLNLDRTNEQVDLLVKGKGNEMITRVTFRDASRRSWELVDGHTLRREDTLN